MKKKNTNKQTDHAKDAANAADGADVAVEIREWWACGACGGLIVVELADTRYGLLKVRLDLAFDERGDWYELDAIGNGGDGSKDGGHAHYRGAQFKLPEGLRKHILREAVSRVMTDIAESLTVNCDENPDFCAYLGAVGMKDGRAEAEDIKNFADEIEGCGLDGDEEDDEGVGYVPRLRRLANACKKLWGNSRDMEQVQAQHGYGSY